MDASLHPRLNVLIAHREPLIAAGVNFALQQEPGLDVQIVSDIPNQLLNSDIVVMDYLDGLNLIAALRNRHQEGRPTRPRLMVITAHDREYEVRQALEAGIHGYVLANCQTEELTQCVRCLAAGLHYMSMAVAQRVAESMCREPLTPREVEVLRLLASGQCNKSIAHALKIALGTVKAHVKSIMSKLDACSRTHAVSVADGRGLIDKNQRGVMTQRPNEHALAQGPKLSLDRLAA